MVYKIIATTEIEALDEDSLKTLLQTIKTFVTNNNGSVDFVIREKKIEIQE